MSRRTVLGSITGLPALLLAACGPTDDGVTDQLIAAISEIPDVDSVELEIRRGAEFGVGLSGTVHISPGTGGPVDVFDEAVGAIARVAARENGYDHLDVSSFTGRDGGEEITVFNLDHELVPDSRVRIELLYERYGLA
ncbi:MULTISPECIES: hypothetical protein [unclassified Brachybacterium]|uniref:hypothetical protein n=1 Tax=unclassified Brachybacterium TaxID=2623841 RepID=UPI00360D575C